MWWSFKPYVSVAQRRANAARQIAKMEKKGCKASPVRIEGRAIAKTFWGKAWCDHLESYSDYENRLPRGRTYVRNGSVVDLRIEPGRVTARVAGSELYTIKIHIKPAATKAWSRIRQRCAGQIGSLIELLGGKLSQGVMQIITDRDGGLFPNPSEIELDCSCPDWADMCKHVAAALYGVGARLDEQPELLFLLRKVDHLELIAQAGDVATLTRGASGQKTIAADELADVFGIEMEVPQEPVVSIEPIKPRARMTKAPGTRGRRSKNPVTPIRTPASAGRRATSAKTREPIAPAKPSKRKARSSVPPNSARR